MVSALDVCNSLDLVLAADGNPSIVQLGDEQSLCIPLGITREQLAVAIPGALMLAQASEPVEIQAALPGS